MAYKVFTIANNDKGSLKNIHTHQTKHFKTLITIHNVHIIMTKKSLLLEK